MFSHNANHFVGIDWVSGVASFGQCTDKGVWGQALKARQIPAIELEANVVQQMRLILRAPDLKARVAKLMTTMDSKVDEAKVCIAMLQIDKVWDQLFPAEQERIVRLLIKKVVVTPHTVELQFRPNGLERLAAELKVPTEQSSVDEVAA